MLDSVYFFGEKPYIGCLFSWSRFGGALILFVLRDGNLLFLEKNYWMENTEKGAGLIEAPFFDYVTHFLSSLT